ncbi:hypothetical protein ACQ9QD_13850 [Bacillus paralicheniformis]
MNVNKELFLIIGEIKKAKSFKNVFWKSPFLETKKERKRKRKIFSIGLFILFIYYVFGRIYFFKYIHEICKVFEYDYLMSIIFILIPVFIILFKTLSCFSLLVDPTFKTINELRENLSYIAFKKYLQNSTFTEEDIEKYLLPFVESKNSVHETYSIKSFLKVVIPSIIVGVPVSLFGITANNINENLKEPEIHEILNQWLGITLMIIFLGAILYKVVPTIHLFSDNKYYKDLEKFFYNYLLEKNIRHRNRCKRIRRKC